MNEEMFKILFKEFNILYLTSFKLLSNNKIKIKYRANNLPLNIECEETIDVKEYLK